MAGLTATLSDLLGALSQSFRLSVYLPALVFVSSIGLALEPYIRQTTFYKAITTAEWITVAVLITLSLLIAYALAVLNVPLTQLYEGYAFRDHFIGRLWTQLHYHRKKRIEQQSEVLSGQAAFQFSELKALEETGEIGQSTLAAWKTYAHYLESAAKSDRLNDELMRFYPQDQNILPTRLGNVFAKFEEYPRQLYGMESVLLWPRMGPLFVKSGYSEVIERQKMGFDFFINLSFLSLVFAVSFSSISLYFAAYLNLLVPIVALFCSWLFYRFAIMAAQSYGVAVRVAFDLHRSELRKSLGIKDPKSFEEETQQWQDLASFLLASKKLGGWTEIFEYPPEQASDLGKD